MPPCSVERESTGTTATYRLSGRFEGACAWELSSMLAREMLPELVLDFSQVGDYVDHGIAVVATALLARTDKRIHLRGLRQHQLRLFKYFGVDPDELLRRSPPGLPPRLPEAAVASEVA